MLATDVTMETRQSEVVVLFTDLRIWEILSSTQPAERRASASWSQHSSIVTQSCAKPWRRRKETELVSQLGSGLESHLALLPFLLAPQPPPLLRPTSQTGREMGHNTPFVCKREHVVALTHPVLHLARRGESSLNSHEPTHNLKWYRHNRGAEPRWENRQLAHGVATNLQSNQPRAHQTPVGRTPLMSLVVFLLLKINAQNVGNYKPATQSYPMSRLHAANLRLKPQTN